MTNKEAIKLAYTEFQKDFEEGEETNQWLTNVIDGLKQAEKDLEILEILKKHIYFSSKSGCIRMKDVYKSIKNFDYEELKEWLK